MKKISIVFAAFIFSGVFADADGAANSYAPSSGTTFTETENEKGKTLAFTDACGNSQTASVGDGIRAVSNPQGVFIGYELVPAAKVQSEGWQDVTATDGTPVAVLTAPEASSETAQAAQ